MHKTKHNSTTNLFTRWLTVQTTEVRQHKLQILTETAGQREQVLGELCEIIRGHYLDPEITTKRLAELGAPKTAMLFKEQISKGKRARSGEIGEIFATEVARRLLGFKVPINRLRWKDGREMALRGDDIVALLKDSSGKLKFLKGESKSRISLVPAIIKQAGEALDRNRGRPNRHSVLFVANRLRELGDDELAAMLENSLIDGFRTAQIEHLLFTFSGNNPESILNTHLSSCKKKRTRHAVGMHITDHRKFVELLFSKL